MQRRNVKREFIGFLVIAYNLHESHDKKDPSHEKQKKPFYAFPAIRTSISVDSRTRLVILITLAELEISAVLESEVLTTRGNDRVIA